MIILLPQTNNLVHSKMECGAYKKGGLPCKAPVYHGGYCKVHYRMYLAPPPEQLKANAHRGMSVADPQPESNKQCLAITKSGVRCPNNIYQNGYCYFHRHYQQEVQETANSVMWVLAIICMLGAMMYGCSTGDWQGAARWAGGG